jgi:poly(3-hydroxybutyrate) depolymerase
MPARTPDQATTEYYKRSLRRPPRSGEQEVNLGGTQIKFFTYRPVSCVTPRLLLVFHGLNRNADGYRDYAQPIADNAALLSLLRCSRNTQAQDL